MITKELFIESIEAIRKQHEHDVECSLVLKKIYANAFTTNLLYDNHILSNQLTKILQVALNDEHEHSWIEYYMWEMDFGKKDLGVWRKDGSKVDLSDAGKLYDFLIENMER